MRRFLLIILVAAAGCRPTDVEPPEITSFSYRSDGTRRIMPVAVPKVTTKITPLLSVSYKTTPLPLPGEKGFAIGTWKGELAIFNERDSLTSLVMLAAGDPVYRIAANNDIIVAQHLSGTLTGVGYNGTIRWQRIDSTTRSDMNLAGTLLLTIADQGIRGIDITTGTQKFQLGPELIPVSAASNATSFFVALSHNTTTGSDSVYKISFDGVIEQRWGFPRMRITSNIALAGEEKDHIVFGAQGDLDASGVRRSTLVVGYDLSENAKQIFGQELDYIPTNISVSNDIILASGFQMGGGDFVGAIDAFLLESNEKIWQRRFTEPLGSPVAVTTQHAFFTLSFASTADIPSNTIFYALELPSGQTAREVAVTDARNGFVPGLPIPYKGALLLADAISSTIYKLTAE